LNIDGALKFSEQRKIAVVKKYLDELLESNALTGEESVFDLGVQLHIRSTKLRESRINHAKEYFEQTINPDDYCLEQEGYRIDLNNTGHRLFSDEDEYELKLIEKFVITDGREVTCYVVYKHRQGSKLYFDFYVPKTFKFDGSVGFVVRVASSLSDRIARIKDKWDKIYGNID
jgi:predicted peptidase